MNMEEEKYHKQAVEFYRAGAYEKSLEIAKEGLKSGQEKTKLLCDCGNASFMLGNYAQAEDYYEKSLSEQTENLSVQINYANALFMQKKYRDAVHVCLKILDSFPKNTDVLLMLANIYLEQGQIDSAENCLKIVLEQDSKQYWAWCYLSQCLQKKERYKEALESGYKAVLLSNGKEDIHINFMYTLYEILLEKDWNFIQEYAEKWLAEYSKNPLVSYAVSSLKNDKKILVSSPEYVQKIFDDFADSFDESLAKLEYKSPEYINSFIRKKYLFFWQKNLRILDLGCGTGLLGKYLQNYVGKGCLDGVDLSTQMLEQARRKKFYDNLYGQDIIKHLQSSAKIYDLITAADVLVYFGKVDSLFSEVSKSLKKGGRFVFTVSKNSCTQDDYFLHASGRFVHSKKYIEKVAQKTGFSVEYCQEKVMRKEAEKDVWGWLFSLRKK